MNFFIEVLSQRKEIEPDSIAWILASKNCLYKKNYNLSKFPIQYDMNSILLKLIQDITKYQPFYHIVSQNIESVKDIILCKAQEYDENIHFILQEFFSNYKITHIESNVYPQKYKDALEKVGYTIELFKTSNNYKSI